MDALIEELASTAAFDLPGKVSQESVIRAVGRPSFFMRIAELCDAETDEKRRERYRALADNLSNTLSAVVERATDRLDDASDRLAEVLAAASEEDGEFLMPLTREKRQALKDAVSSAEIDETMLATVNAAAAKAEDDGMPGVVAILRKVLQLYAADALAFDPETATSDLPMMLPGMLLQDDDDDDTPPPQVHPDYVAAIDCYTSLLESDADDWDRLLRDALIGGGGGQDDADGSVVGKDSLLAIVQAQIERVVLLQENGSYKQRVQAEFLRELVTRIEANAPAGATTTTEDDPTAGFVKSIIDDAT